MKAIIKLLGASIFFSFSLSLFGQEVLSNSLDALPVGWTGKKFELSKSYPTTLPNEPQPWKSFNFKTQPLKYINAVKKYVLDGNILADWVLQNNSVRKWYHAPAMIWGNNGREFINGMTRERSSLPRELHPSQINPCQNWAVGFYNPRGGYTLGKVYTNPNNPNSSAAIFSEGTVAAKLLFTNAPVSEVPYLQNAFEWQANIHTAQTGTTTRSPQTVRLLQMDIAIKDNRANSTTNWVMITFAYNNNASGTTPWEKLVPVGLQWGNDPSSIASGSPLTQSWINPAFTSLFTVGTWTMHTGYNGRLNGPVDNPKSSCLSCHGTAQSPKVSTGMVPANNPASIAKYFRNIDPPAVFEDLPSVTEKSLDYSLQLTVGIPLAESHASPIMLRAKSTAAIDSSTEQEIKKILLTTRDFENEEENSVMVATPVKKNNVPEPKPENPSFNWKWITIGAILLVVAALFIFLRRKN